ncbi:hypothetical protein HYV86_01290 [Candidatus Woesearchaeota archaeon]|nr:hypothetical protein [Candidatus Woesearchaeota archaeon]
MNPYEEQLKVYLQKHHLKAQHFSFTQSCHSVAEAAETVGASPSDFIKSICCTSKTGDFIVCILKGEDKLDLKKVKVLAGCDVSIAKPEVVLEKTGYPVGGTPPIGYVATFYIDQQVMEKDAVYGGGGSPQALVRIAPVEMINLNNGKVVDIRQVPKM